MEPTGGDDLVLAERKGGVLLLTLNRPSQLNAWNDPLEERYFSLLDEAEADPEVRAIVLTGSGRAFCAGADLGELEALPPGDTSFLDRSRPRAYPRYLRKPLIAAINGAAAGLGLVEALFCDIRFCVPSAKLTTAFSRRGLTAEYGIAHLLTRLAGPAAAADLLFSGRVVDGNEALTLGLVNEVVEPDQLLERTLSYAEDLAASCSPASLEVMKRQLREALDSSFDAALNLAEVEIRGSFHRPDVDEGVAAYLERRPPRFPPLDPVRTPGSAG